MGRHRERLDLDAYSSPIRLRAQARGRLAVLALGAVSFACAAASGAALALATTWGWNSTESWRPPEEVRFSYPSPTLTPPPLQVKPDPVSRIIMQNPDCWMGVPGQTCGPERTFLGE